MAPFAQGIKGSFPNFRRGGRHDPGGPEASAWSVTGTDQLPEDNGGAEKFDTLTGSADFNASGSCRPPEGLRGCSFSGSGFQIFKFSGLQIFRFSDLKTSRFSDFHISIFFWFADFRMRMRLPGPTRSRWSQQSKIYEMASDLMIFHQNPSKFIKNHRKSLKTIENHQVS